MNFTQEHLVGRVDFRAFYATEGVKFRGKRALCPFHDDSNPSLDVDFQKGVYICRACGEGGDPVTYLQKRQGLTEDEAIAELRRRYVTSGGNGGQPPPTRRWEIRDVSGQTVADHCRRDAPGKEKEIWWERDGSTGLHGLSTKDLPLYASERLVAADPQAPVIITEGEKAADALLERGYVALGTVTGATATPGQTAFEVLRGRRAVLWPDNDGVGRDHMKRIATGLAGVASSVQFLSWGEREHDDAADFFERGGTEGQLDHLLADASERPPNQPPAGAEPSLPTADQDSAASAKASVDAWPTLDPTAFHGLAGEIVQKIKPHTEADPVNVLVHFLTMFGNALGGTPHVQVGARLHGTNINAILVGETSHARKGEGEGQARRVISEADPKWAKDQIVHGLSSGEGLIDAVHDLSKAEEKAGVEPLDRRLLLIETEFAGTLRVMRRDGNSLSTVIRQAWDSGNLRTMTRKSPLRATAAHVSIIGHATPAELLRYMEGETENGFANRFLWFSVRRPHLLPDGGSLTSADLAPLCARVEKVLEAGKTSYEVTRSPGARELWAEVYPRLTADHPGLFGSITSRAEAQTLRLSLLYALLDGSKEIRVEHLKAALALWEYAADSVRHIFGDLLGDPIADRILRELRALRPEGLTRTEIASDLFSRNVGALMLERAFLTLKSAGLAFEVLGEAGPRGGPRPERWFAR